MPSGINIDPAPRSYPQGVTLVRRAASSADAVLHGGDTAPEIEKWLLGAAVKESDLLILFKSFVVSLNAAGLSLDRASLHIGTLHPQLFGFAWVWDSGDGLCDEIQVTESVLSADAYKRNPLFQVIEWGEEVRCNTADPAALERYPLVRELAAQGITEYVVLPIGGSGYHNAASMSTKKSGGFVDEQIEALRNLLALFALHVERHIAQRIAVNVLDTYLGSAAGRRVLEGSIRRGEGEAIDAVLWISDLRNFTDLIDRLDGPAMISLLNVYFDILAGAVLDHGGEVLKFIGDGLLAVFPLNGTDNGGTAAHSALAAARQALAALDRINREPPAAIENLQGWQPLRTGIALHEGAVFFGNVGASARLDFTVIGRAVNAASRVEGLCKTLGRSILVTEPVARRLATPLEFLGDHRLRGLAKPLAIYGADPR